MSKDRQQPYEPPSNLAVMRDRIAGSGRRLLRKGWSWVLDNRSFAIIIAGVCLLTIPVLAMVVRRGWEVEAAKPTRSRMTNLLIETLAVVDAQKFREARQKLEKIDLAYLDRDQATTVEYILGALAANEADEYVGVDRHPRFRAAAEHLKRSRELGYPYQHESQATFLLGKSLFHSGELTESREFLEVSLNEVPERASEIHGMLAEAYRWGAAPQFDQALSHNRKYLASTQLSADERHAAILREAEIHWKLDDVKSCSAAIAGIPADSPLSANAAILRGRILLHEAEQARLNLAEADAESQDAARARFQKALDVLRRAQQDPLNTQVIGKAMYLIGVCYLKLEDSAAALEQLRRTSRIYENTPEGLAAGIEEADLLRKLGRHDEAIASYVRTFDGIGLTTHGDDDNPWMSRDQFRARALEAYQAYMQRSEFARATQLVEHMAPLVLPARAAELAAELRRDWARDVIERADTFSEPEATAELKRGRLMLREAGVRYQAAAKLNFSNRQYTEDIWQAAECFRLGHNYTAASAMYEEFMKYEAKKRRSAALVGAGECLLSLNRPEAALDALRQCYEMMPNDVASYNARLLASLCFSQLGKPKEAEVLLRENIGGNLLTPESTEWRESLFELGRLLVREERHNDAIKVLSEAVARYPDSPPSIEARYLIAEEFRRAAQEPQAKAQTDTIETARVGHLKQVQQYLTAAIQHYEDSQRMLNRKQEREELSPLEKAILRNSYFAVGMAMIDLGRYEDAIRAYSTATNRYQHTPEVLEAFVQIASCYRRLNRPLEARGTVRQAKVVLNRLPELSPYEQTTNFSRQQWVELLDWLITM